MVLYETDVDTFTDYNNTVSVSIYVADDLLWLDNNLNVWTIGR